ncbi:MAG: phosphohistidine phosphatase SixA [Burkholderiales bacterium]
MELILWRHADAEDAAPGAPDASRKLTARGEKQARRMASWLGRRLPRDALILVSRAKRAQQTAHALARKFETSEDVGPAATPQSVLEAADWPRGAGTVLVVGHQPTLGQAAALVLTGAPADWSIQKGAIWWLEGRGPGEVAVRAVIAPDMV